MEKIDILMATYNGEKYLQEQLDSIYRQKNVMVDVLVRDDGSSDLTQEILEMNSKTKNLTWYSGEHKNVQKGFFELMRKAAMLDYEYYAFCDQDDVWFDDKLSVAISRIPKTNIPTLYYSGQQLVDENLNYIEDHKLNSRRNLKTRFILSDFAGCTGVFNKALISQVVVFEPKYMMMHDTWVLRVCLAIGGNVIVDPEARMKYRQHSGNTLGLGHSFSATLKQVKQYICEYQVERVTRELVRGYDKKIVAEYREICDWICGYKNNKNYRKKLLDKSNVDFFNRGLNFTYWIKVRMNKL